MIKLKDICFAYDCKPIISHMDFSVDKGEFVVIKGDNGCGKTTLLNIINGLDFPEYGVYEFNGETITEAKLKKEKVAKKFHQTMGYVFQNTDAQLFCSSVEDEIAFGPNQMGLDPNEIKKRVDDVIKLFDIEHLRDRAPYQLSMGEKKKVAIASVIAINPEVITLDEPMNFLDKKSKLWIKDFLVEMNSIGKTIIIVSHTSDFNDVANRIFRFPE